MMKTLCQDCLRIVEVSLKAYEAVDYGKGMCECGGEVCHCESCMWTIDFLNQWDWSIPCLEFKKPIFSWTPEGGMVIENDAVD